MSTKNPKAIRALAERESMNSDRSLWLLSVVERLSLPDQKHNVDVEACEAMKELHRANMSYRAISDLLSNISKSGVSYHVKGKCSHGRDDVLSYSECGWMRVHAREGMGTKKLADKYDVYVGTIRTHLKGECHHEDGILPLTQDEMSNRKSILANYRE